MKIETTKEEFVYIYNLYQRLQPSKFNNYYGITITQDSLGFYGMDASISVELKYNIDIDGEELFIIPDTHNALEAFMGAIESSGPKTLLTTAENAIKFNGELPNGGKRQATMKCTFDDFISDFNEDPIITFDISPFDLMSLINSYNFADKNDGKLSNMRLFTNNERIISETADGYKLKRSGIIDKVLASNLENDILLPAHDMYRLSNVFKESSSDIQVEIFNNKVIFKGEIPYGENKEITYKLSIQRANTPWPELDKIMVIDIGSEIKSYPVLFTISKYEEFRNAIFTALRFVSNSEPHIFLKITKDNLCVFTKEPETGDIKIRVLGYENVNWNTDKDSIVIGVNGYWLKEAVSGIQYWGIDELKMNDTGFCIGRIVSVKRENSGNPADVNGLMIIPLSPNKDISYYTNEE